MAKTNIEWTSFNGTKGQVWNPTTGCAKISQGCKNCYAEKMHKRLQAMGLKKYQRNFNEGAFLDSESLTLPLKIKKPTTFFVNSMSDLFQENLCIEDVAKIYAIMFLAPQHAFQVLTKRPYTRQKFLTNELFFQYLHSYCNKFHDKYINRLEQELYFYDEVKAEFPLKNVWEGVSIENKETLHRTDNLRNTPAVIRWISAEPLLEDISEIDLTGIDWVVCGFESGPNKRGYNFDWASNLLIACQTSNTKFFMKQIDKIVSIPERLMIREYPSVK